ncbi:hypothetical protein GJ496_003354 [Pomphorhynchus laevis]|nr:hypothetical protein GJ496_003354 [Pomphorhynchus laevis]
MSLYKSKYDIKKNTKEVTSSTKLVCNIIKCPNGIDCSELKELKRLCKSSPLFLRETYECLLFQLRKANINKTINIVHLLDELVNRSSSFRNWILDDLDTILDRCLIDIYGKRNESENVGYCCRLIYHTLKQWQHRFPSINAFISFALNSAIQTGKIDIEELKYSIDDKNIAEDEMNEDEAIQLISECKRIVIVMLNCLDCIFPEFKNINSPPANPSNTFQSLSLKGNNSNDSDDDFIDVPEIEINDADDLRLHGLNTKSTFVINVEHADKDVCRSLTDAYIEAVKSIQPRLLKAMSQIKTKKLVCQLDNSLSEMKSMIEQCIKSGYLQCPSLDIQ